MFNKFRSEEGTIATVYVLGAALFFATAIALGFGLGKTVQANQMLNRCTTMTAKATMVYMQRQPPPDKGVLTPNAISEGTSIFKNSMCNSAEGVNPLIRGTVQLDFRMIGPDTLLVTSTQYLKGFLPNGWFPTKLSQQAAAYTYQYGGQGKSPLYGLTGTEQLPALMAAPSPLLGSAAPESTDLGTTDLAGEGATTGTSSDGAAGEGGLSTAPPPVVQATYDAPYPDATEGVICHATSSANKYPYRSIGPSPAGIINGHMDHSGPVFDSSMKSGGGWGDIIPPMPAIGIDGLNWTPEGKAVWHNGCDYWTAELP